MFLLKNNLLINAQMQQIYAPPRTLQNTSNLNSFGLLKPWRIYFFTRFNQQKTNKKPGLCLFTKQTQEGNDCYNKAHFLTNCANSIPLYWEEKWDRLEVIVQKNIKQIAIKEQFTKKQFLDLIECAEYQMQLRKTLWITNRRFLKTTIQYKASFDTKCLKSIHKLKAI